MKLFNHSKNNIKRLRQITMLAGAAVLLNGCLHPSEDNAVTPSVHYAVISTQASDNQSGDISIISLEDFSADNTNYGGLSDTVISTHEDVFYRIGRLNQDNVSKFQIDAPDSRIWQHNVNDASEEGNSNPYKLVAKDKNSGYLIRYGSPKIWVVNLNTSNLGEFKIGEIDLGHYALDDGIPEAADALLIDDKLYVLMQNLDRNNGWIPGDAYVAIFDIRDNSEIATNSNDSTPKGIRLIVTNPSKMKYLASNNMLYVAATGAYFPSDYTGGIESINLTNYNTEIVVDDGDIEEHPYGQINNIAILNSTRGYFVGSKAWKDDALYHFNPSTGIVNPVPLESNNDIEDIEIGPLGNLWMTDRDASGIKIFDTVDNSIAEELISTDLVPYDIEFISVKQSD